MTQFILQSLAPGQVTAHSGNNSDHSGYTLIVHPDFLLSYQLAGKIKQYGFFSYSASKALHLSHKEKETIVAIFKLIDDKLQGRINDFSQDVLISQPESLLKQSFSCASLIIFPIPDAILKFQ
ncbi:hypothetical protein [Chitinophaga tropicalis]|uniref:hypothetical protein n=1 Tax=Chitinophaga tropicalis TaxID=2683588 RepID=UPI0018DFD5E7|nr:hypothetical protein [Chitinophaga tropicalis]